MKKMSKMSDLERSYEYCRKLSFLTHDTIPTQSEIRGRFGDSLSAVLFENAQPTIKRYLGLVPILDGPGDDLWVSPSDLLIGKVRLKPPLTYKHVQALTHQGIMEIGHCIEKKVDYEHKLALKKALDESEFLWKYWADLEKQAALLELREKDEEEFKEKIQVMITQFEIQLEHELEHLEDRLELEKWQEVDRAEQRVRKSMQERMEFVVWVTVHQLLQLFGMELFKQSKKIHEHFWYHIKQEKKKFKETLERERKQCKENLKKLRYELECENFANVMFLLAQERTRCDCQKEQLQKTFLAQIHLLKTEIDEKNEKLLKYIEDNERQTQEIVAREQFLFELIQQFQKFVYYSLRAVPQQAEFLLNVENLMKFELTRTVIAKDPSVIDDILFGSSSSCLCASHEAVMPPEGDSVTTYDSSINNMPDLVVTDHHNCQNYVEVIRSAHTMCSDEDMPMFLFNENVYVREDFRNMVSQGIRISQNNELWSRSLEKLTDAIAPPKSSLSFLTRCPSLSSDETVDDTQSAYSVDNRSKTAFRPVDIHNPSPATTKDPSEIVILSHAYDTDLPPTTDIERHGTMSRLAMARDSLTLVSDELKHSSSTIGGGTKLSGDSTSGSLEPLIIEENEEPAMSLQIVESSDFTTKEQAIVEKFALRPRSSVERKISFTRKTATKSSFMRKSSVDKDSLKKRKSVDIKEATQADEIVFDVPAPVPSKIATATNSLELLARKSVESKLSQAKEVFVSKSKDYRIDEARNSLELIPQRLLSKPNVEMSKQVVYKASNMKSVGIQADVGERTVSISHFQVIPDSSSRKISFKVKPNIIYVPEYPMDDSIPTEPTKPEDDFFTKPNELKVAGDPKLREHLKTERRFLMNRTNSFIGIFKKQPSLMRLFTETLKN